MTLDTLLLLRTMLTKQSLQIGAEDFRPVARQVLTALDELDKAITEAQHPVAVP